MSNKKTRNGPVMVIMILLSAAIIGCLVGAVIFMKPSPDNSKEEKAQGVVGRISDNWDDQVSEDPDTPQQSGTQSPGYSAASMKEGDTSLVLRVGNPKDNKVGLIATVRLEDGTELYKSPVLEPGQGLEEIPLEKTLKKGEYNAEVFYQCVLLNKEHTPLNAAISAFTLYVD